MKTLSIFGSTGSVGSTTLSILKKNNKKFNLLHLSAHTNYKKLKFLQKKYKPKKIILTKKDLNYQLYLHDKNIILEKDLFKKNIKKIDYVISGASGYGAIDLNLKLLKISKNLLIANKETLICGGEYFFNQAKKNNCNLIPIDSEHYCIDFFLKNKNKVKIDEIETFYLIASGGPFLNKKINYNEKIKNVISHPNWRMGKKITVDSSNLTNKVLELFEAKFLFKIKSSQLKILIESKSNVHAVIKFKNNIVFSIMHTPKMYIPISDSLNIRNNFSLSLKNLNIKFIEPDTKKFPIVRLGYYILKLDSHAAMILFTVFNERLVNMYLKHKIKYGDIVKYLVKMLKKRNIIKLFNFKVKNYKDIRKIINIAENLKIL